MIVWALAGWAGQPSGAPPTEVPTALATGLSPVVGGIWDQAVALEAEGALAPALVRYRAVRTGDPDFGRATLAIARVELALGNPDRAVAALRERPYDADAVEALGALLYDEGRYQEAAETLEVLVSLRPEWPGALVLEARALARVDPVRASEVVRDYLGLAGADPVGDGLVSVVATLAESLRASARRAEAADLVEVVLAADPDSALVLTDLLARIQVDLEASALSTAGDVPLLPQQRERLREARTSFSRGEVDAARRTLEVLVLDAPDAAPAWGALAEVREAQGDAAGAEAACRIAMRLDPQSAEWPARQGDLLSRWFAGRFDAEAVAAYRRAVLRRPDDAALWFRKAEAERRAGRWQAGVASMARVLALDPIGPHAQEARRVVEGAELVRDPAIDTRAVPGRPASLTEDAWWSFLRAQAWRERPEPWAIDEALTELSYVRRSAPTYTPALALEAEIHTERGEVEAAVAGWEAVRAAEPAHPEAAARLATFAERAGDQARADELWTAAAAVGHPAALLRRARARAARGRWWSGRVDLREVFTRVSSGPDFDDAIALDRTLELRIRAALVGAAGLGLGLAALPAWWWSRRRAGVGLDAVVARSPGSWRDLARLLSAVQHEVVKHNFGLLESVAAGLDERDPEGARFAAERWFGPEGAIARLGTYVEQLEELGRAAGVPLNLRWCDPRFRPLLEATEALAALEPSLRTGSGPALADALRRLAGPLGTEAHRALGGLVHELCVLVVDERLLRELHRKACAEFPDRHVPAPRIVLGSEPVRIRMFRADLEDVVVNLVRNAIEATPEGGDLALGLLVGVEEDAVTLLERVTLTVADHAPGALTTRDLRSRHISRGLGLAVDLVTRAAGSMSISKPEGYAKGVVVRIPKVDPQGDPP